MKLILCDTQIGLVNEWKKLFDQFDEVTVAQGSIFAHASEIDALVSPANSFGFMDGGFDYVISETLGWGVQKKLQTILKEYPYNGELLVGQAVAIPTDKPDLIPYVISAPTMRVPMILGRNTANVYLAMKAVLYCADVHPHINSIAVTGLGTGVGQVPSDICALQMFKAYTDWKAGADKTFPKSWKLAQNTHQWLYTYNIKDLQFK